MGETCNEEEIDITVNNPVSRCKDDVELAHVDDSSSCDGDDLSDVSAEDVQSGGRSQQLPDVRQSRPEFEAFYTSQSLCGEEDWQISIELLRTPLPPSFRILCHADGPDRSNETALLDKLRVWQPEPVPWSMGAYRLRATSAFGPDGQCDTALNKVLMAAQRAGHISRQETASMLPVQALGIESHHKVLELCAAPGSKTMQILDLFNKGGMEQAAPNGMLVANDYKQQRIQMLIERVRRIPTAPLLVTCTDARAFPALRNHAGDTVLFDRVLCDVPCSGDGTVRKALGILSQWSPLSGVNFHTNQLAILLQGLALLKPGGILAYSTCALNPVECEAVVGAALWEAQGSVETVMVDVPGLPLAEGLTSWKVPSPSAYQSGAVSYTKWEEVLDSDKSARVRLHRSMFPPGAYVTHQDAADDISKQLRRCARLLPAHDDGGCFFLALLRRVEENTKPLHKGERVLVRSLDREAVVREPRATGPFAGLVRIAYDDGSRYHVAPEDLERIANASYDSCIGSRTLTLDTKTCNFSNRISDEYWTELKGFFGFVAEDTEAALNGVCPFGRDALTHVLDVEGQDAKSSTIYLTSSELSLLATAPHVQAAGRPLFVRMASQDETDSRGAKEEDVWPADAFPWRPAIETAQVLARICTRRVLQAPSQEVIIRLLTKGHVDASELGVDSTWLPGAVIVVPAVPHLEKNSGLAYVGLLHGSRVRLMTQKGRRLNYGGFAQPCRFELGTNFRVGEDNRARWVPSSRRCAR